MLILVYTALTSIKKKNIYPLIKMNGECVTRNMTLRGAVYYIFSYEKEGEVVSAYVNKFTVDSSASYVITYDSLSTLGKWGFDFLNIYDQNKELYIQSSDLITIPSTNIEK